MSKYLVTLQGDDEPELGSWLSERLKGISISSIKRGLQATLKNISLERLRKLNLGDILKASPGLWQVGALKRTFKLKNPLTSHFDERLKKIKKEALTIGAVTGKWDIAGAYLTIKNKQISGQRKRYLENLDKIAVGTAVAIATAGAVGLIGGGAGAIAGAVGGSGGAGAGSMTAGALGAGTAMSASAGATGSAGVVTGLLASAGNLTNTANALATATQVATLANQVQQHQMMQQAQKEAEKQAQQGAILQALQQAQQPQGQMQDLPFGSTMPYYYTSSQETEKSDNTLLYAGAGLILLLMLSKKNKKRGKK